MERLFGNFPCSAVDRIDYHILRHDLNVSRQGYIAIAEQISAGKEGVHSGAVEQQNGFIPYVVVVKGRIELNGQSFGIVRSVRSDGSSFNVTCIKHGNFSYAHGFCPLCDLQLNSESGRE